MTAKDFLGKEIKVGDTVAYMDISYRSMSKGMVLRVTEDNLEQEEERSQTFMLWWQEAKDKIEFYNNLPWWKRIWRKV